jgi:hypothetical protein
MRSFQPAQVIELVGLSKDLEAVDGRSALNNSHRVTPDGVKHLRPSGFKLFYAEIGLV